MVAFISVTINNDENKQFKYHSAVQIVEFRILFYDDKFNRLWKKTTLQNTGVWKVVGGRGC